MVSRNIALQIGILAVVLTNCESLSPWMAYGQEKLPEPVAQNVLTQAVQILNLGSADAGRQLPVRLRGVLTFYESRTQLYFVQDESGGVYFYPKNHAQPAKAGDLVELTGTTAPGSYSPLVSQAELKVIGKGQLPAPKTVAIEQLASGTLDCQWGQIEGVVHRANENWGHLVLNLESGSGRLTVRILERGSGVGPTLIDARVRVQGVIAAVHDSRNRPGGFHLLTPSMEQVTVVESGSGDPFSRPLRTSRSLKTYHPGHSLDHRVHLRGTVTLHWPGKVLFIRDESGSVRVHSEQATPARSGEVLEVAGFPVLGESVPAVTDAIFRTVRAGEPVAPQAATPKQATSGELDNELIRMEAQFVAAEESRAEERTIYLRAGEVGFHAQLPMGQGKASAPTLLPGSKVQITGICTREANSGGGANNFKVLLRSREDLRLLQLPTGQAEDRGHWLPVAVGAAAFALGLGWVGFLWKRVANKSEALGRREAALIQSQSDRELSKTLEERERIARDLHDSIIQSIYAVGLNLENCRRLVSEKPSAVEGQLGKMLEDLNRVIKDVRNFVLGLESDALKGQEFKTALKSVVLTLGDALAPRFSLQIDSVAALSLSSRQATQLLHIAREAVSNSVRHAQAERTVLSLQIQAGHMRFEVRDNGTGFDTRTPRETGRGLRNMATRANEMGAAFSIVSQAREGTRITLDIPMKNPHESG